MNKWYDNWMNQENLLKRASIGCDNTFFFTGSNINNFKKVNFTPDKQPTPQEIKDYWVKKFTREFQGKEIENPEVEDLKKEEAASGKSEKKSKKKKGSEESNEVKKAKKKSTKDIPGIDLSCNMLDISMLDIPGNGEDDNTLVDKKLKNAFGKNHPKTNAFLYGLSKLTGGLATTTVTSAVKGASGIVDTNLTASTGNEEDIAQLGNKLLKNLPLGTCICKNYIPTGIFEFDWKYYRMCFLNFKQMIRVAKTQGKKPEFIEKRLRQLFLEDFFNNFGGDFLAYRELLLKFDENYRKLCKLKLKMIPSGNALSIPKIDYMILKLEAIDGPMKLMKKSLEDREATAKYLRDRGWKNKTQ